MKIVIPMSGTGDRFRRAGYSQPKPLIPVDGRPMIEHVIDMFPGEHSFVFICNREHLQVSPLASVLTTARPDAQIIAIEPHKLGPVHAVCQALDAIADDEEVVVNYCDFGVYWDYADFLRQVRDRSADGAISAYRGFHPHSLGSTYYAYLREQGGWMVEIREKESFTSDRLSEFASAGTYYFSKGELVRRYFPLLIQRGLRVNGEYYVSLVYNLLREDGYNTFVYELQHFLQWGTPEDLEEYHYWSDHFRHPAPDRAIGARPARTDVTLMLAAGRGHRFAVAGHTAPKPLVPVTEEPMLAKAIRCLPGARRSIVVCLREHLDRVHEAAAAELGDCETIPVETVTAGQACTALLARDAIDSDASVLIAACDSGTTWSDDGYSELLSDASIDAIVWTFRSHASLRRTPRAFSWVTVDGIRATRVSMKMPLSDSPQNDHAVLGSFYFRRWRDFVDAATRLIDANRRTNGEFYIDDVINVLVADGKNVVIFNIAKYLGWGTPDDVKTYEYWHSYFEKSSMPVGGSSHRGAAQTS